MDIKAAATSSLEDALAWHTELDLLKAVCMKRLQEERDAGVTKLALLRGDELMTALGNQPFLRVYMGVRIKRDRKFIFTPMTQNLELLNSWKSRFDDVLARSGSAGCDHPAVLRLHQTALSEAAAARDQYDQTMFALKDAIDQLQRANAPGAEPVAESGASEDISQGWALQLPWFPATSRGLGLCMADMHRIMQGMQKDNRLQQDASDAFVRSYVQIMHPSGGAKQLVTDSLPSSASVDASGHPAPAGGRQTESKNGKASKSRKQAADAIPSAHDEVPEEQEMEVEEEEDPALTGEAPDFPGVFKHCGHRTCSFLAAVDAVQLRPVCLTVSAHARLENILANVVVSDFQRSVPAGRNKRAKTGGKGQANLATVMSRCLTCKRFSKFFHQISLVSAPKNVITVELAKSLAKMPNLASITLPKSAWESPAQRAAFFKHLPAPMKKFVLEL